jgi:hypothetical protein
MRNAPMKIDEETRVYVRVAMRDTLEAYDLVDLLDVMAGICQDNADNSRGSDRLGLSSEQWQRRADMLRDAAEQLERREAEEGGGAGQ